MSVSYPAIGKTLGETLLLMSLALTELMSLMLL